MFLNRIVLIGRLCNDPEERFGQDSTELSKFRIAVNRQGRAREGQPDADFFNVVCFRHSAKFVNQYLRRGNLVAVEGRLQIDEYTDREGVRKQWVEVTADNVQNLTPRGESADGERERSAPKPRDTDRDAQPRERQASERRDEPRRGAPRPQATPSTTGGGGFDDDEDDPFADE